jgi:hypothetical protein
MKILTNMYIVHNDDCEIRFLNGSTDKEATWNNNLLLINDKINASLPDGWVPDAVVLFSPQNFPIPIDIEKCQWPLIIILDDWFGCADFIPDCLRVADYIFTDLKSMELLNLRGFNNVGYWPAFSFDPQRFEIQSEKVRNIDILFVGSCNSMIQTERLRYLKRICDLDEKYTIEIHHSLWNDKYIDALNRARIVFNRSIKNEMNCRCFEATACGALLFIEEGNQEIGYFLETGKECVVYNDTNLEELLCYYLEHETERAAIAAAGNEKIQKYTYANLFSELLDKIKTLCIKPGENRKPALLEYASSALHRDFVQVNMSLRGRAEDVPAIALKLVEQFENVPLVLNDCAVMLMLYVEDRPNLDMELRIQYYKAVLTFLQQACTIDQRFLTARFNIGQIFEKIGDTNQAKNAFEYILQSSLPLRADNLKGIIYPVHYRSPFRYLWNQSLIESFENEKKICYSRYKTIQGFAAMQLSLLCLAMGDTGSARSLIIRARTLLGDHPAVLSLILKIHDSTSENQLLEILNAAINANPFNIDCWRMLINYFEKNDPQKCLLTIKQYLITLSRGQLLNQSLFEEIEIKMNSLSEYLKKETPPGGERDLFYMKNEV